MGNFSHDNQLLMLKDHVYALPEGAYLFPFNGRVHDTINEIPILVNSNVTYRDDVKKFLGSVAIENGTTNEATGFESNYTNKMDIVTPPPKQSHYPNETVYHLASGSYSGIRFFPTNRTLQANEKFSVSAYVYLPRPCTAYFNLQLDSTEANNEAMGTKDIVAKDSGWYRLEWNNLSVSVIRNSIFLRLENGNVNNASATNNWNIASSECWITAIQFERQDQCTSFTTSGSTRANGSLSYDISSLKIKDKCHLSFWIRNSYDMRNTTLFQFWVTFRVKGVSQNTNSLFVGTSSNTNYIRYGFVDTPSNIFTSSKQTTDYQDGEWLNIVIQWDKADTVNGKTMEFYINGELIHSTTVAIATSVEFTELEIGQWSGGSYITNSQYEQLIIHPSKTFSAKEIEAMYKSSSPMFDWRDQILFW